MDSQANQTSDSTPTRPQKYRISNVTALLLHLMCITNTAVGVVYTISMITVDFTLQPGNPNMTQILTIVSINCAWDTLIGIYGYIALYSCRTTLNTVLMLFTFIDAALKMMNFFNVPYLILSIFWSTSIAALTFYHVITLSSRKMSASEKVHLSN